MSFSEHSGEFYCMFRRCLWVVRDTQLHTSRCLRQADQLSVSLSRRDMPCRAVTCRAVEFAALLCPRAARCRCYSCPLPALLEIGRLCEIEKLRNAIMITSIDRCRALQYLRGGRAVPPPPPPTDVPSPRGYHFSMCIHCNNRDTITLTASGSIWCESLRSSVRGQ